MEPFTLSELAEQQLQRAGEVSSGRSTTTVYGGRDCVLGQIMVALRKGAELAEHDNPGDATVHVLRGRARLGAGESWQDGAAGDLLVVPRTRHNLEALEDTVVLLTIAKHPAG